VLRATPQLNLVLSERRAQAVTTYIGAEFGVSASRMKPIGMGENQLLVPTAAQVPEERNRRVQVVNIGN
jgi:outer membrane protein OmpA-like peptidoglycan-associated protein